MPPDDSYPVCFLIAEMMPLTADRIISFYQALSLNTALPPGIRAMNPMEENEETFEIIKCFFRKFYNDNQKRTCLMGINPGRFGGGLTGIPFTDPKRLQSECRITYKGKITHEPSSVFIYEMINAYGGPGAFYSKFYVTAVSPLGFTKEKPLGGVLNYNYYDLPALQECVLPFIKDCLQKQLPFLNREVLICIGTGKNEKFLQKLNNDMRVFNKIIALEHPRFIMQYKAKEKTKYIDKYLRVLEETG